ncbi:MAG: carbohydrate kinase family protein [Thiolinea sp.]
MLILPPEQLAQQFVNEEAQLAKLIQEQQPEPTGLAVQLERLPDTQVGRTLGARGACWFHQGQQVAPSFPVEAVDTTGAGDTFTGYFLQALTAGAAITTALRQACAAAALCVQRPGASVSIPDRAAVQAFLENH